MAGLAGSMAIECLEVNRTPGLTGVGRPDQGPSSHHPANGWGWVWGYGEPLVWLPFPRVGA